jgi:hypothetical protein
MEDKKLIEIENKLDKILKMLEKKDYIETGFFELEDGKVINYRRGFKING